MDKPERPAELSEAAWQATPPEVRVFLALLVAKVAALEARLNQIYVGVDRMASTSRHCQSGGLSIYHSSFASTVSVTLPKPSPRAHGDSAHARAQVAEAVTLFDTAIDPFARDKIARVGAGLS